MINENQNENQNESFLVMSLKKYNIIKQLQI